MDTKHYIKCNKCNSLVAVKSEFMVLCPVCNKKLNNSYRAWLVKNRGRSYAEYLSTVCVSDQAIQGLGEQHRITRIVGRQRALGRSMIALVLGLVIVAAAIWGTYIYKESQRGASINSIINDTWKIAQYADLGVTVKFPFVLQLAQINVDSIGSSDTTQVIEQMTVRNWIKPDVTNVTAMRIIYKNDFTANRDIATQQILQSIVQNNAMQGFEYIPSDYSMANSFDARMFSGSYLVGAQAYQFRAVMAVRRNTVWYFMVAYYRSMPEGTLLAEKFFRSIILND